MLVDCSAYDERALDEAAQALRAGKPAIFPTDTVYGLGVSALHAQAPSVLYDLKQRASDKPVAWLVGSPDDLAVFGRDVPAYAFDLARKHWPGALTLIVRASEKVPAAFQSADGTIGLRMPDHPAALDLIRRVGCPLATTSANISGQPAPYAAGELDPALTERVEAVLVDNRVASGVASTVVGCMQAEPAIMRQGEIIVA